MSLPRRELRQELRYFAYKHPTIWGTCKATLCVLSTPLCCCICCCCWLGYCGRGDGCKKGTYRNQKRAHMNDVHWRRKAQTLKRRRSLSIGATNTLGSRNRTKKVSDQGACPLFTKLPTEIREMIYQYVLIDTGAFYWRQYRDWEHRFNVVKAYPCLPTSGDPMKIEYEWHLARSGGSGCAFLRTCRLVYTETIPILYRNTQFRFSDYSSLHAFSAITPTSKLRHIRSLWIDWSAWLGIKNSDAIIRLKCWENLRFMYILIDELFHRSSNSSDLVVGEAEPIGNCVFYFLVYATLPQIRNQDRNQAEPLTHHWKLQSYKHVDPKGDPNWRNADWCMVE
ncbi:hypothetical protein DE146DRAFT_329841 [Phaeosphaeria sp. MPI-PUGE-AT-0046c]|nr:hypothetical protein DE146DRAFT_329841 [Phaeosphaeria sp. MPI-PUGE-AT-0046c]